MHLKTIQANGFKTAFEVLKDILNDVNIQFTPEGVRIVALDNAKAALVNMRLDAENFEEYSCDKDINAGVNIANFFKLLKIIGSNDILTIDVENKDTMNIIIENDVKNSMTKFELNLLWINEDILEIPKIDRECTTIIPSVDFQRICRDMNNIGDEVRIFRNDQFLEISCKGDFAKQFTKIDTEQPGFEGRVGNTYSLKYINFFTKSTNMCSTMKIQQSSPSDKIPIIFVYNVANLGEIEFLLAAKLD